MTFDEGVHLTGGYACWAVNDYRLLPESGNWSQRWAALPVWWDGYQFPPLDNQSWQHSQVFTISDRFFFDSGNDADSVLWSGRLMMSVPSVLLGALVYLWSRRLFVPLGGLLSLTLYAFSPTMLANGFLTTSDLFAALFFTAAIGAVWTLLHRVSLLTVACGCCALAGLSLSKFSGVLVVPMALLLLGIRLGNPEPLPVRLRRPHEISGVWRQLAVFAVVAVVQILVVVTIIWASYGFRYSASTSDPQTDPWPARSELTTPLQSNAVNASIRFARDHHLLPEAFLYGFSYTIRSAQLRNGFLNGHFSQLGWTAFFPCCLALKTPLTLFVLLGLGGWACIIDRRRGSATDRQPIDANGSVRLYALAPLLVLLAVYWAFSLSSNLNIGQRHLLPTYPAMFILAGAAALWFQSLPTGTAAAGVKLLSAARALVAGALVVTVLETIWFWPHYLAYFNALAGGPRQGYRRLVDSSLDWGQDLKELKRWLDLHPNDTRDVQRVYLSYFGVSHPNYYGIQSQDLTGYQLRWESHIPRPLNGGLYCISATLLQSMYLQFPGHWNRTYERYYQDLRLALAPYLRNAADPAALAQLERPAGSAEMQRVFLVYEVLRLRRLCSFLRTREPDDEVGYSILIYRLTDADVARALEGPPCELLPEPETEKDPQLQKVVTRIPRVLPR